MENLLALINGGSISMKKRRLKQMFGRVLVGSSELQGKNLVKMA
jgi:hypothetical protein